MPNRFIDRHFRNGEDSGLGVGRACTNMLGCCNGLACRDEAGTTLCPGLDRLQLAHAR
jgi:hypothetical protein